MALRETLLGLANIGVAIMLLNRYTEPESAIRWVAVTIGIGGFALLIIAMHRAYKKGA